MYNQNSSRGRPVTDLRERLNKIREHKESGGKGPPPDPSFNILRDPMRDGEFHEKLEHKPQHKQQRGGYNSSYEDRLQYHWRGDHSKRGDYKRGSRGGNYGGYNKEKGHEHHQIDNEQGGNEKTDNEQWKKEWDAGKPKNIKIQFYADTGNHMYSVNENDTFKYQTMHHRGTLFRGTSRGTVEHKSAHREHRGSARDHRGNLREYRGTSGQFRGHFGEYRGHSGEYRGHSGEYRGHSGEYRGDSKEYGHSEEYKGHNANRRSRDAHGDSSEFRGRGRGNYRGRTPRPFRGRGRGRGSYHHDGADVASNEYQTKQDRSDDTQNKTTSNTDNIELHTGFVDKIQNVEQLEYVSQEYDEYVDTFDDNTEDESYDEDLDYENYNELDNKANAVNDESLAKCIDQLNFNESDEGTVNIVDKTDRIENINKTKTCKTDVIDHIDKPKGQLGFKPEHLSKTSQNENVIVK